MSGTIPQLGDPFSAAASQDTAPGFLGQSPAFWQHLAMLGGNMVQAANARTPSGHLANGVNFAGPFGAAIGQTAQQAQGQALAQARVGQSRAETEGLNLQNQLQRALMPPQILRAQMQTQGLQDPNTMALLGYGSPTYGGGGGDQAPSGQQPAFESGVHQNESGGSMAPGIRGDGGQAYGPMQVHPAALKDVNAKYGTNLTPDLLAKYPELGKWAGDRYLEEMQAKFGPIGGVAAYNAGPGRMQDAIDGKAPLPLSTVQYAQRATGLPQTQGQVAGGPGDSLLQQSEVMMARAKRLDQAQAASRLYNMPVAPGMADDPAALRTAAQQFREQGLKLNAAGPLKQAEADVELKTAGAIAAEKAKNSNVDLREGGMARIVDPTTGQPTWIKNPKLIETQDAQGNTVPMHASPALPNAPPGSAGTAEPVLGPDGNPVVTKQRDLLQHFWGERGSELGKQFNETDEAAQAAKNSNYLFDNMRQDAKSWSMDQFAPFEAKARSFLVAAGHLAGFKDEQMPSLSHPLADYTAFTKSSGTLLREAVHETSSRAAVQEYKLIGESLPVPATPSEGFGQVADQWQGFNDFRLAKQKFMQFYTGKPEQFEYDFNSRVSPTAFMLNRMSQTPEGQSTMQRMLANMQQTPEGKMAMARMLQGFSYARQNGLFDNLSPVGASLQQPPPPGQ